MIAEMYSAFSPAGVEVVTCKRGTNMSPAINMADEIVDSKSVLKIAKCVLIRMEI